MTRLIRWGAGLVLALFALALLVPVVNPVHALSAVALAALGLSVPDILTSPTTLSLLLAFPAVATPRDLKTVLADLRKIQDEYKGKAMPEDVGQKFDELATEAKAIQDEVEREGKVRAFEAFGRQIPAESDQPQNSGTGEGKADPVVGYISLGEAFVHSPEFKGFLTAGLPQGPSIPMKTSGLFGRDRFLALTAEELKRLQAQYEGKAVPTIGAGVIEPQRLGEVVRDTEMRDDFMRSILNVQRTGRPVVEYITHTTPAAHAAAPVAEGGTKPQTTTTLGTATAPTRTLAVWMPVTEQQLQDVPQVQDIVDTELRYELALEEDKQFVWGDGTGQNLLGIFNTPGVAAGRTVVNDTLLDKIRRSITDVRVARGLPNGVGVHPYDWEALQLLKGTDSRYVWVIVTEGGVDRLWGLSVVQTVSMQEPTAVTTPERRVLVGDFVRGATVWDYQNANVAVGWINDQFITNQRTLRAEERLAFGVKRPGFFRYVISQAEVA